MVLLGGSLVRNHELLLKNGLPLQKNVTKWLTKNALIPLWLTPVASLTYTAIQKIFFLICHASSRLQSSNRQGSNRAGQDF